MPLRISSIEDTVVFILLIHKDLHIKAINVKARLLHARRHLTSPLKGKNYKSYITIDEQSVRSKKLIFFIIYTKACPFSVTSHKIGKSHISIKAFNKSDFLSLISSFFCRKAVRYIRLRNFSCNHILKTVKSNSSAGESLRRFSFVGLNSFIYMQSVCL